MISAESLGLVKEVEPISTGAARVLEGGTLINIDKHTGVRSLENRTYGERMASGLFRSQDLLRCSRPSTPEYTLERPARLRMIRESNDR